MTSEMGRNYAEIGCYAILDLKSQTYNQPYFLSGDGVAMRQLHMIANDPESMVSKYPNDYRLFRVGTFNIKTGEIASELNYICDAASLKKTEV